MTKKEYLNKFKTQLSQVAGVREKKEYRSKEVQDDSSSTAHDLPLGSTAFIKRSN